MLNKSMRKFYILINSLHSLFSSKVKCEHNCFDGAVNVLFVYINVAPNKQHLKRCCQDDVIEQVNSFLIYLNIFLIVCWNAEWRHQMWLGKSQLILNPFWYIFGQLAIVWISIRSFLATFKFFNIL